MYISKKHQAIIDAFETEKEKNEYIDGLARKLKESSAKHYKENPEKYKEYYKENAEKLKEYSAKYYKENAEKLKESRAKRYAKKKAEKQLIETL